MDENKNKAIADALAAIKAARQGNIGQSNSSESNQDPRLKQPTTKNSSKQKAANSKKHSPQIGDRGNAEIQAAEEAERQANAYKDAAEKAAEQADTASEEKQANDLADAASKTAEEAKDLKDDIEEKGGVGNQEAARLERIKKALEDLDNQAKALEETDRAVFTSQQLAADKKRRKEYEQNVNMRFIDSIYNFIRNEIASLRTPSWKRFSKRYVDSSPLLQKGKARTQNEKIPKINVYFDRSGSWDDDKIKVGQQAVSTLRNFERKGLIKINIYYFSDTIESDPNSSDLGNGTSATELILRHIVATKADNVIIMTDSDMDNQGAFRSNVVVDGGVWFGFVDGRCNKIMQHLKGKKLTKAFDLKV